MFIPVFCNTTLAGPVQRGDALPLPPYNLSVIEGGDL